jgi:hypothetical protein
MGVPVLDVPIEIPCGQIPVVGAEGRLRNTAGIYFWEVGKGEALEVIPFPAAESGRTLLEQLLGAAGVIVLARVCRRGDALVVQGLRLFAQRRLHLGVAETEDRDRHDQQSCPEARHDGHALVPPGELAEPTPGRRRAGLHRLVREVPLDVGRQRGGRLVPARTVLL